MATPEQIEAAKVLARELGVSTGVLGFVSDYVRILADALDAGYSRYTIEQIVKENGGGTDGVYSLANNIRNLKAQNEELAKQRQQEEGARSIGIGSPEEILRGDSSNGANTGIVSINPPPPSPTPNAKGVLAALIASGQFDDNQIKLLQAYTPEMLINLAQDLRLPGYVNTPAGSGGPSEGDKLRSALSSFNPVTDLIKLGTSNKYFNKITGETIDLTDSDPTKFTMVNGPDGQPTGYMVNDKGQSIDIGAGKLAQLGYEETVRRNQASEQLTRDTLNESIRSNQFNEAETRRRNDIEQGNLIANMQANPGKWVQREFTIANMQRPSGINEPGTYTGPTAGGLISGSVNPNLASDQARAAQMAADINSGRVKPPGPVSTAIEKTLPTSPLIPKVNQPIGSPGWIQELVKQGYTQTPTTQTGIISQSSTSPSYSTPEQPNYIETPNTQFDDGSTGTGYSVSQEDFDSMLAAIPGYANGTPAGMTTESVFEVGDPQAHQQGLPGANPEIITNPTNAPIGVQPVQDMAGQGAISSMMQPGMEGAGQQNQVKAPTSPTKIISQVMALLDKLPGDSSDIAHDVGILLVSKLDLEKGKGEVSNDKPSTGPISKYAYGTYAYGATDPSAVGSSISGNILSGLTTTPKEDVQALPSLKYLRGGEQQQGPVSRTTTGAFGEQLPEYTGINYGRYLDLRQDPASFGLLSGLYSAASRNLEGEAARAKRLAPIGNAMRRIRT